MMRLVLGMRMLEILGFVGNISVLYVYFALCTLCVCA